MLKLPLVLPTEYRVANSESSFVLALCSKMGNSIGIPIEDLQEDGKQHSRLWRTELDRLFVRICLSATLWSYLCFLLPQLISASLLAFAPTNAQWGTTLAPVPGCPPPAAVAPCLCEYNSFDEVNSIYCRDSITSARLKEIFATADFPVTTMASFTAEYCTLDSLPAGVFGPMKFESITVSICELTSVDQTVLEGQSETLKSLNLNHNKLATFPFSVSLPNLESLHITNNQLTSLPALKFPSLKFLNVEHNSVSLKLNFDF